MSTYVYGFTHTAHPLEVEGITGVGPSAPPLRVVRHNGLAAVVSDAPDDLRAKRRDLEAHEAVLEKLSETGTILPMRFGTVAPDDDAVVTELGAKADRYGTLLTRLDGKAELNVKARHREEDVLRDLLVNDRALREWNETLRAAGGGTPETRMEFGEEVAAALEERRSTDAAQVLKALEPHAERMAVGPPVDGCFANASFLVADTGRADFDAVLSQVREALAPVADVDLYGPLPPYSFVTDTDDE